jgi:hypothetical protein
MWQLLYPEKLKDKKSPNFNSCQKIINEKIKTEDYLEAGNSSFGDRCLTIK